MEIVTAADAAYVPHTAAMLHSLFTAHPQRDLRVNFLHRAAMPAEDLDRLAALCARFGARFRHVEVARDRLGELPIRPPYVEEAWYRVVLPQLLGDVARALWLDADTIVLRDVTPLWDIALGSTPLAACPNAVLYRDRDRIRRMGIPDRRRYFNTGVLLMDLARMRSENSERTLRAAIAAHAPLFRLADQDALSLVYHDNFTRLPLKWNVLTSSYYNIPETIRSHGREEYREAMRDPCVLHFTGQQAIKPWYYKCGHPYRDAYLAHRKAAGWGEPEYPDRTVRYAIMRRVPLRLREVVSTLRRRQFAEALSYLA